MVLSPYKSFTILSRAIMRAAIGLEDQHIKRLIDEVNALRKSLESKNSR
jgi:hypothetical protein